MTRETRIGLLVGLLFIVMFALVLSELTGNDEFPTGALGQNDKLSDAPVVEGIAAAPRRVPRDVEGPIVPVTDDDPPPVVPAVPAPLDLIARQRTRVSVDASVPPARRVVSPAPAPAPAAPRRPVVTVRRYKVVEGDRLIDIAKKFYGDNNGHLYHRIVKANQDVLGGGDLLRPGQVLVIPRLTEGAVVAPRPAGAAGVPRDAARPRRPKTYRVRPGDTLTHIAAETLGDDSPEAVQRIIDANANRLDDPDLLLVGLQLVIPE